MKISTEEVEGIQWQIKVHKAKVQMSVSDGQKYFTDNTHGPMELNSQYLLWLLVKDAAMVYD